MLKEMLNMVTGFPKGKLPHPETAKVARESAEGGMVLLKNNGMLPIKPQKIALFGTGAEDTVYCGTGSGYAFSPYRVSVRKGLEDAGFQVTSTSWLKRYWKEKKAAIASAEKISLLDKYFSGITRYPDGPIINEKELKQAKAADTALYVISRNTGENFDRKAERGDYYLSSYEIDNLKILTKNFAHVAVILNTCVIDAKELEDMPGISAIILMGPAGLEAGHALANIITGKVNPSGHLTDTWACDYKDYPASATFSANDGNTKQEDYCEDIFVGYRYFDSFNKDVIYPFGYGLSYTNFNLKDIHAEADWNKVRVSLNVCNTGNCEGREVIQLYASAPQGKLIKPWQELKAYKKTGIIAPGKSETITLEFETEQLASYSEEKSAWIMEPGDTILRIGRHSRDTIACAAIRLDREVVIRETADCLKPDHSIGYIYPKESRKKEEFNGTIIGLSADDAPYYTRHAVDPTIITYVPENRTYRIPERIWKFSPDQKEVVKTVRSVPQSTLFDVKNGKVSMEEFVASLDEETLLRIVTGSGSETPHPVKSRLGKAKYSCKLGTSSSGKTTSQYVSTLGIPAAALADGPAGLHLIGSYTTCYPVGIITAQNWDTEMAARVGDCFGIEMETEHVTVSLSPGMNIHRDPLCGRSFEYYSEDPLLTGKTAAAYTKGMQENHPGHGVALKHFATNNQELDRIIENNTVSKRALREIYLKGFEICVREAKPMSVMSSYNCLNGCHTSSNYELLTEVLRGDWGFEGFVMTDWDSQSTKDTDIHAGNDIIMGGYPTDILSVMLTGKKPSFDDDGAVHLNKLKMYGGLFSRDVESWGSFVPQAEGNDEISVTVAPGKEPSERIKPLLDNGAARIDTDASGTKKVIYRGTDRGAYLPLGDLQRNAIRVLTWLMNSAAMDEMKRK